MKEGRWDKSGVDHSAQEALAKEAKRRGLPEHVLEAAKAVPTDLVRSIVNDFRTGPSQPSSIASPSKPKVEPKKGTGWSEPRLLVTPYVSEVDRIAESFAAEDRAKRAKELRELKGPSEGKR